MNAAKCPVCTTTLNPDAGDECPNPSCRFTFDCGIVRRWTDHPPPWVVAVGLPKHGKSTYIESLMHWLSHLGTVVRGFRCGPGSDTASMNKFSEIRRRWYHGDLPESTQVPTADGAAKSQLLRPLVLEIGGLPAPLNAGRDATGLVLYDVPGELYFPAAPRDADRVAGLINHVPYLLDASQVWFFVSLVDLQPSNGVCPPTLSDLFESYRAAIRSRYSDLSGRHIIVVYTKADRWDWPAPLEKYWNSDPFLHLPDRTRTHTDSLDLSRYLSELQDTSLQLRAFTEQRVPGGEGFIAQVEADGGRLSFCMTSSTGGDPDSDRRINPQLGRYRIIDPFLLMMLPTHARIGGVTNKLVIDQSEEGWQGNLLPIAATLERGMARRGGAQYAALGQSEPIGVPQVGTSPPRRLPALIGPILRRSPGSRVAVVSNRRLIDLNDYHGTSWSERLALVRTTAAAPQRWPLSQRVDGRADPDTLWHSVFGADNRPASSPRTRPTTKAREKPMNNADDIRCDPAGYPFVYFECVGKWVNLLPITKIQFEQFICDCPSMRFDAAWYDAKLQLNPRISPHEIGAENYWQALMTGLTPEESGQMTGWVGDRCELPTEDEWLSIYKEARSRPVLDAGAFEPADTDELARRTIARMTKVVQDAVQTDRCKATLADQMLMHGGCQEWVHRGGMGDFALLGLPPRRFAGGIRQGQSDPTTPYIPSDPSISHKAYGFRLVWSTE